MEYGKEFRNLMSGLYTREELSRIKDASLVIAGVGGSIGSYLIDVLVRKGFENFTLAEPEDYEIRNLSRQLFANTITLGKPKLEATIEHITKINPCIKYRAYPKVDLDTVEEIVKGSTVVSYQAEGFSPWLLTRYACSKYHIPFVNVARKRRGNSRTTIATTIFNYKATGDIFDIKTIEFEDFGIPPELSGEVIKMFDSGKLSKVVLDEADKVHKDFKKKKRFKDLGKMHPEVGSIIEEYSNDYFKRYTDPEICLTAAALASRAITDLVIGRTTRVFELDIFSKQKGGC